jgi:hypothetical protein
MLAVPGGGREAGEGRGHDPWARVTTVEGRAPSENAGRTGLAGLTGNSARSGGGGPGAGPGPPGPACRIGCGGPGTPQVYSEIGWSSPRRKWMPTSARL